MSDKTFKPDPHEEYHQGEEVDRQHRQALDEATPQTSVSDETRGVVYLFCGMRFAARMLVAWQTLRDHYDGPVTVMVCGDGCQALTERVAETLRLDVQPITMCKTRRRSAYLTKTMIPAWTPYDRTVFIDGDTVVVQPFEELFDDTHDLTITSFSTWHTQGRRMRGRCHWFDKLKSKEVDAMVARAIATSYPAINTGVFAFRKGFERLDEWHELTTMGAGIMMTDEIAMQLLYPSFGDEVVRVVDDRFNCSPIYGANKDHPHIWHFHGNKHLRRDAYQEIWAPAFDRARQDNLGGLADWAGTHDRSIADYLVEAG